MKDISDIDINLRVVSDFVRDDVVLYDPRNEPFTLYGVHYEDGCYRRLPKELGLAVSEGVAELHKNTAGGRICFTTDSDCVGIVVRRRGFWRMPHMAASGSIGFDLYVRENGFYNFHGNFMPDYSDDGYQSLHTFHNREKREIIIHFPLYSGVDEVYVVLNKDAKVEKWSGYTHKKPIVFYGSSITQGGCASLPSSDYVSRVARRFDSDYINLGFSGSARAEESIMKYIAGLDMSIFVYDYDYNSPSAEHLRSTHERGFLTVRNAHPDLPIILANSPNCDSISNLYNSTSEVSERREIVKATYENALAAGDKNVYFVDSTIHYPDFSRSGCTVDGCHPTDLGFWRMAQAFGSVVAEIFKEVGTKTRGGLY